MRYSILLLIAICSFCGCGGGGGGQPAKLRVIIGGWAVPTQNLTVSIDGTAVATGVSYPTCVNQICQQLSDYVTVKSGGVDFVIVASGSTNNLVPSGFQKLNLAPNTQNTFVLGGATQIQAYLFTDDSSPASGSVKLRVAIADAYPLSVSAWVNTDGSTTGNPTISGITVGSASSYLTLTPGSYFVTFSLSCPLGEQNCIAVGPTAFAANQNITAYVLNEGDTFRPLLLADN